MKHKIFLFSSIFLIYLLILTVLDGHPLDDNLPEGAIARFSPGASVFTVAYSSDGTLLASGGDDNAVILWDVATRSQREIFTEHSDSVMSVVFSPNSKILASASLDGFVRLWDITSERGRRISLPHNGWVKSVAFSPNGKTLASGGGDESGTLMWWDVSKSQRIVTIPGHSSIVESVAFSPDGELLASTSRDKTVKLWYADGQRLRKNLAKHKNVVYAVAFSPDGKLLATSSRDKTIRLWKVSSGENVATFQIGRDRYVYSEALVFSPDGQYLASACVDHSVILWEVDNRREVSTIRGHDGGVTSIAFSPDGRTLATGSRDRTILLWNLAYFNILPSDPIPAPISAPDSIVVDTTQPKSVDSTSTAAPISALESDSIVADTTQPKSVNSKPTAPTSISAPDSIVVDTTPPNIVILSPKERIVPQNIEQLLVQGEVDDDNSIGEVKVNGREVWVSAEGRFTATVPLTKGENEIRIMATDMHGNMETERFTIVCPVVNPQAPPDLNPPTITLDVPKQTEEADLIIQGRVTDNSGVGEVKVNDMAVYVSADGIFTATVPVSYGETEVRVTATDVQGNMETNRFAVFRKFPPIDDVGPEIRILEPVYNRMRGIRREIHINAEYIAVAGTVTDPSGVAEVRINGIEVELTGHLFTVGVELIRGDNVVRITAVDKLGNDSEEKILIFRPYSDPIIRKGKDHALLFAVEDYDHWPKLHKPVSDAETIQHDLETLYGFQTRLIKNPTQADIFQAIREYAEMGYSDDDQLFVFFAGHGYFDDTFKGGYLVARDTQLPNQDVAMLSYVSHSVIRDIIDRMNCKHIFLVLDTCYSGTFDRLIAIRGKAEDEQLIEGDIKRKFQYTTRWYLTSGGKEIVYDESSFVHQFLEALRSKGGADNILTIDEILSYVMKLVKPKPRASGFGSDEPGSDFLFFAIE